MEKVKLCELADIYLGVTHTPEYVFNGVPFLSVKDISGGEIRFDDCKYISQKEYDSLSEGAKPKVGDMLFCRVGTLGKPIIIPEGTPLFGSFVSLGYLRNKNADRCDLNYLRYWMYSNSFWKQVNSNVKGASQVNLNTGWLSKFDIDLPDMQEQKYRISVLDKCKVIIEQREEELKVLDDLIKARFVEMFGVPGTDINGWEVKKLGDCCEINPKKGKDSRLTPGIEVSFVPMSAVSENGTIDPSDTRMYDDVKTGFTYFAENDVLMAKITPCMENGKGAVAVDLKNGIGFGSTEFHVLRPIRGISNSYWIYVLTSIKTFREDAASNMTGSAGQRRVPATFLENFKISIPPIELQNQFADFVRAVDKSKVEVQKALDKTQMLFDSLMQQYFG